MSNKYPNFGSQTTGITWQDWWMQLVHNVFRRGVDSNLPSLQIQNISERLLQQYRTGECYMHVDGNVELLRRIRDNCDYVGVISNTDPGLECILRDMNIRHEFDFVYTSYELGVEKPHYGAFQKPLDQYSLHTHEALHIGNLYDNDYLGARNAGWCSLLITQCVKDARKAKATHVYSSLEEMHYALETTDIQW